jgi:hypothetical protein
MPRIELDADVLFGERPAHVASLLEPLFVVPHPSCSFFQNRVGVQKILGVGPGTQKTSHPEECWFRTFSDAIWCQYLEHWVPNDQKERRWHLTAANLHVSTADRESQTRQFLLMVHSERNFEGVEPMGSFKRGPHLHVSRVREGEPLAHCHFPLNLGHLDRVLSSSEGLSRALSDAVKVVRCEVVEKYAHEVYGLPKEAIPEFPWEVWAPFEEPG